MQLSRFFHFSIVFLLAGVVPSIAQDTSKANETLLAATSPFEDIVEFALAGNDKSIKEVLAAADHQAASVKAALPVTAANRFYDLLQTVHKAASAKEYQLLAETAVEVFRILLDGLQPNNLKVPKEVSLLDYAGFKLRVLANAAHPNWDAMYKTAEDASAWWKSVESRVSNTALRDAFSSTVTGLREAAKNENLQMLNFAIQIDLDLVDLLENHFEMKR